MLHVKGIALDATCVATALEVEDVTTTMIVAVERLIWLDDDGSENWQDPPRDPRSGENRSYEFARRTPWPETSP